MSTPSGPFGQIPHAKEIGLKVIEAGNGEALLMAPYRKELIGDPETAVIAGGVLTTLLDTGSGIATLMAMDQPAPIVTLDLRIDYMRGATPGRDIYARCRCTRRTREIAFVYGICYHDTPDEPIATSVATFMLAAQQRGEGKN